MATNGGNDRVSNRDLYESQRDQDEAMQHKLDKLDAGMNVKLARLESMVDERPTSRQVWAIVAVSVAANQALDKVGLDPEPLRSALAFIGF